MELRKTLLAGLTLAVLMPAVAFAASRASGTAIRQVPEAREDEAAAEAGGKTSCSRLTEGITENYEVDGPQLVECPASAGHSRAAALRSRARSQIKSWKENMGKWIACS
jgi:hypothetical protein